MERIVHRPLLWMYFKAFVVCYVTLVSLFVFIDAGSNLDEFAKRADGGLAMAIVMSKYYVLQQLVYVKYLGVVVAVLAGLYTLIEAKRERKRMARTRA